MEPDTAANRALYHAVVANDPTAVRQAFDAGASPNTAVVFPMGGGLQGGQRQSATDPLLSRLVCRPNESERPGVVAIFREFLDRGFDLQQSDVMGTNAIYWAVHLEDAKLVRVVVDRGADINVVCQKHLGGGNVVNLIVSRTLKHDEAPMVPFLQAALECGAHPDIYNARGMTPLHKAAFIGIPRTVELLLQYGANPALPVQQSEIMGRPAFYQNATPLVLAQRGGNAEVIRLLTAAHSTLSPIEAVTTGNALALKMCLDAGGSPDARDESGTPYLLLAATAGHEDAVWLLLERGASVHVTGSRGATALHCAALYGHPDICRLLLERGADVNAACGPPEYPTTALIYAVQQAEDEVAALLLEHGANLAAPGNRDALERLLQTVWQTRSALRGNPNRRVRSQEEVRHAQNRILHLLLAKMDLWRYGGSALCTAAEERLYTIAHYLIEQGVDMNTRNRAGKTVLMAMIDGISLNRIFASPTILDGRPGLTTQDREEIQEEVKQEDAKALSFLLYLLTKTVDLNARCSGKGDCNGLTVLSMARRRKLEDVAAILAEAGAQE